jgi:hypothetical protein
LLLSSCSLFAQSPSTPSPTSSAPGASPSSSPVVQGIWVLAPNGVNLRDQPALAGAVTGKIPQGEHLTATDYRGTAPGWYLVEYQGNKGWVAKSVPDSNPPVPLVTVHPQLLYSSPAAGYQFLYPASWQVVDKGADVEADAPSPIAGASPAAGQASPAASNSPLTAPRLVVHEAKDISSLGTIPTRQGSLLDQTQIEVYGITTIRRTFQLTGGGYEVDVRLQIPPERPDRAVLINFLALTPQDLDIASEILYSFYVTLRVAATPTP